MSYRRNFDGVDSQQHRTFSPPQSPASPNHNSFARRSPERTPSSNLPRSPARTPRRRIRDPDSDSDSDEADQIPSPPSSPPPPPVLSTPRRTPRRPAAFSARKQVRQYLDVYAAGLSRRYGDDDDEADDERKKGEASWREKYYDDSLGSLEDFIVPDDYESSGASDGSADEDDAEGDSDIEEVNGGVAHSDEDEDDVEEIIPLESPVKRGTKSTKPIVPTNSTEPAKPAKPTPAATETEHEDDHLLHFSPPPRLLNLPDLGTLILDSDSDSDSAPQDDDDDVNEIIPLPQPKTPRRTAKPPPKTKTPSKKAWASERIAIAQGIFDELDRDVFDHKLGKSEGGAGATLEWNNRLLTTAGTANSKWSVIAAWRGYRSGGPGWRVKVKG